jgi:hypothetical protein
MIFADTLRFWTELTLLEAGVTATVGVNGWGAVASTVVVPVAGEYVASPL